MIVFWSADPETHHRLVRRAGRHRAPAVAEEEARHQGRPHRSVLQRVGAVPAAASGSRPSRPPSPRWRWRSPMSGSRKVSTTRTTSTTHTVGFDKWKAYLLGEEDGIPKTPEWQETETGVPAKDVRALAREWGSKRVYLAPGGWGNGHGGACRNQTGIQWARTHGLPDRDAGPGQARRQHGQPAMGQRRSTSISISPATPTAACRATSRTPRCRSALPAHAAAADHEFQLPAHPAHLHAGGHRRRQGRRLSVDRQVDRGAVRQVQLSGARPFAGADALQVRRLDRSRP